MENYSKARTVEQPCPCPFTDLPADTPEVRVRDGSKIRNLLRYALSRMEAQPKTAHGKETRQPKADKTASEVQESPGRPGALEKPLSRQILFTATGTGVCKAITCVEIMKRRVKGLHQHTWLLYSKTLEVWEPLEPTAGLDSLTVSRNIPALWILLSRDPLDPSLPGYQAPGNFDALWAQSLKEETGSFVEHRQGQRRKRGGGGGGGGRGGRGKGGPAQRTGRAREAKKGQS